MPVGDEILQWKEEVEDKEPEEITECPYCAWELKVNSKGQKACPICGRIWK